MEKTGFKDLAVDLVIEDTKRVLSHFGMKQSQRRMFTYDSFANGLFIFEESTIKVAGKAGKKQDKAKSDKPSTAKSGQKSEKKVRII